MLLTSGGLLTSVRRKICSQGERQNQKRRRRRKSVSGEFAAGVAETDVEDDEEDEDDEEEGEVPFLHKQKLMKRMKKEENLLDVRNSTTGSKRERKPL